MRIVPLVLVILSLSVVRAEEERVEKQQSEPQKIRTALDDYPILKQMRANIPPTLAEAHAELERMLTPQELAKIDAMPSEEGVIMYHFGLGLTIRNGWGLWADSPLAQHLRELGFTHPDTMSGVILQTFWRKRHGQTLRIEELAAGCRKCQDSAWKVQVRAEEENRISKAGATIRTMVLAAFFSGIFLIGGLMCLILAKIAVGRQGAWPSAGADLPPQGNAALYRIAYILMGVGVLAMFLLLTVLRAVG
jgi:hypothetical protein